nr:Dfg5 [Candida metapsilosis]
MLRLGQLITTIALLFTTVVHSVELNVDDKDSICSAAQIVSDGMWNYYEGFKYGGVVGMFASPNYWWNAGEAFGGLVDYYSYCDSGNSTLKQWIYDGMYHQAGENFNYIPSNQSMTEGNDDQGVWGMAIMEAVERNFSNPESHSWLEMAQAIYNTMEARWDTEHCGGGLRWQIFTWNSGYDYKNAISNGCLFHIAARLARYTGNETAYLPTAERVWNWMEEVNFLTEETNGNLRIYDGANTENNCSKVTDLRWSYTYGVFMTGCAYLYNLTGDETWKFRAGEVLDAANAYFFNNSIMQETTCQPSGKCNNDQRSFRCLFSRCLGLTMKIIPEFEDKIRPNLEASAKGAAQSCSGGTDGVTCGEDWSANGWDNQYGLGEQMSALEVMLALIAEEPISVKTGGTNRTNYAAGTDTEDTENKNKIKIKGKDKAGAGVLTAIVLAILLGGGIWMVF